MTPNEEEKLLAHGWTRRFVGAPPRLKEVVELYRSLGYEVRLETQRAEELEDRCKRCALAIGMFRVVYTRLPTAAPDANVSRRGRVAPASHGEGADQL